MHPTAQHTPGPWQSDGKFIVAPDPGGVHPDIYIAEIAEADDEGRVASPKQQAANSELIAAAPKLLDALIEALAEIRYCHADMLTPEERAHPRGSGWARVWDKAVAAIAEATGGSL